MSLGRVIPSRSFAVVLSAVNRSFVARFPSITPNGEPGRFSLNKMGRVRLPPHSAVICSETRVIQQTVAEYAVIFC